MFTIVLAIRYEFDGAAKALRCIVTKVTVIITTGPVYITSAAYDVVTTLDLSSLA